MCYIKTISGLPFSLKRYLLHTGSLGMLAGIWGNQSSAMTETNGEQARLESERGREKTSPPPMLWKRVEGNIHLPQKNLPGITVHRSRVACVNTQDPGQQNSHLCASQTPSDLSLFHKVIPTTQNSF